MVRFGFSVMMNHESCVVGDKNLSLCALQEEDCVALRSALHIMNDQLAALAEQQQQPDPQVHSSSPDEQLPSEQHEEIIARQKQELAKQQQELAAAAQQLQEVCSLLALKNDSLAHLTRHSSLLEAQVGGNSVIVTVSANSEQQ